MFENLLSTGTINFIFVFIEGVLSFLSPCVLPLIPLYIGYLAGNGKKVDEKGVITYERKTVLINTVLFVLGISFAFFLLGISFSSLGTFFKKYQEVFTILAGVIIIIMGLIQLGVFNIGFLKKTHQVKPKLNLKKVNPLIAFILGFTFSFAWTPCVGPALASVLVLASNSANAVMGNLLVLVYTLGFIIPFLLLGMFTTAVLNFLKEKQTIVKYTIKISAVILIIIGMMTCMGLTNKLAVYFGNTTSKQTGQENQEENEIAKEEKTIKQEQTKKRASQTIDFTLQDQEGSTHTLSEYQGKVVFLNFWATWCPPCKQELPYIQQLYKEYGDNKEDVVILGITNPKTEKYRYNQDVTKEEIKAFLTQNQYTFPVLFDETGEIFDQYSIFSFPTTFMITKEGEVYGYVQGGLEKEQMKSIILQTMEKKK